MSRINNYIARGLNYILHGEPIVNVKANIVQLDKNNLLEGRLALITGGTSGIGYAIADAFLSAGARIIITGRDKGRIDNAVSSLKNKHESSDVSGIVLNNTDIDESTIVLGDLLLCNDIDLLVNNAGVNGGVLSNCSEKEYQVVMDTNLKGTIFITRLISDNMVKKGIKGNVLNICSASSLRPANTAYVLSKWGIRAYTMGLAKSLIKNEIVVNGLAPGPTATPMLVKNGDSNISLPNNPSGRYALPEEIANMAVVLTSGLGRMVVGDIVYMTGGAGNLTFDDINY